MLDVIIATSTLAACTLVAWDHPRTPSPRVHASSRFEHRIWSALATTMVPLHAPLAPEAIRERVDLMLHELAADVRLATRVVLVLFDVLAILRHGRRFARLSPERRTRWLMRWEQGAVVLGLATRLLAAVIKPIAASSPAAQRGMGYDPARLHVVEPGLVNPAPIIARRCIDGQSIRAQVVVIGTGAGGAVVAAELAERGIDVVMLEDGVVHDPSTLGREPLRNLRTMYRDGGATFAFGKPVIPVLMGRTVGGTTTVNSGTCLRVPTSVVEAWNELGLGVDVAALDRAFTRVERRTSVALVGPERLGGSSHVIARGAAALGLAHGPLPRNVVGCRTSAVCPLGCPRAAKQSTNVTYVPAAIAAGARLFAGMEATGIMVANGRAAGVVATARVGGARLRVHADVVVSACGSVPGVGLLRTVLRSRHLGRHLTIHPCTKVVAVMPELVDPWKDTPQGYAVTSHAREGILFEGVHLPPEYFSLAIGFGGAPFVRLLEQYRHLATFGLLVADEPNGRVISGFGRRTTMRYQLGPRDRDKLTRGTALLAEMFFAAGAQSVVLPIAGAPPQHSLDAVREVLGSDYSPWRLDLAAFHPLGTARMAATRQGGVVDPTLQSWELPGLFVVDGSVFPTSLGVNPQLTIMAMATLAAERIAAEC